jgi:arylsulfatase A-like enzyme
MKLLAKSPNSSLIAALSLAALALCEMPVAAAEKPNVIVIYTDDLGYADVSCNGGTKTHTPNVDALAKGGLNFTDGHSPSSTCTPSRFALMTGEYAWRHKGTDILPGDAALIIRPGTFTLPGMMKSAGYATACIGKWHLGLGKGRLDWNGEIKPGPCEVGFDTCFVFPATPDRVPCVYLKDHRVVNLDPSDPIKVSYKLKDYRDGKVGDWPIGRDHPELETKQRSSAGHDGTILNGIARIGYMTGGKAALWKDEDLALTFTQHAVEYIDAHKNAPFFLYFALNDVHAPRVPNPRFAGTSGSGIRGDVIQEMDWCVGQIVETLKKDGLDKNTFIIFSSDNGPVVTVGYADGAAEFWTLRDAAGERRGGKGDVFEGGTRVPMIAWWPGHIKPGVSDALFSHIDLLRSFANHFGVAVPAGQAPDSLDCWDVLVGKSYKSRLDLVEHSSGQRIALRKDPWKLVPEGREGHEALLFNLKDDVLETKNTATQFPNELGAMKLELNSILRSVPIDSATRPEPGSSD